MINIPCRLKKKLEANNEWDANVNRVILNVNDLYLTTPYFFPEYTNHGIIHVNNILNIADKLLPDITLEQMTEKELGIFIISLILHDIGMFVQFEGFLELLDKGVYIDLEENKSLGESWKEYLVDLKYFSEKELLNKFGTVDVRIITLNGESDLDNKTKLVIGEFLRKNHHNISHYIIQNNLVGIDFLKETSITREVRDLIGLIARSHGMNIRDTEMYLQRKYGIISRPININIFYLMVLVRLSDYMDVGVERASHIIQSLYVNKSDISRREFAWNQCMKYEDFNWCNEKELLSIDVFPSTARQFSDVKKWIRGIQYELDKSWAIIGEHYNANVYKITVRRLDSNILKQEVVDEYEKSFHTEETHLDANADILKLLIAPLYGDNPSFGVREILQNAVDACRERERKEKDRGQDYEGEVIISLDRKKKSMEFSDNGIGMKIDVIKKYYLIAGASYRRSDAWSKEFVEVSGRSKILRNGKFGIGVLATFLLGEKATITTRSMDEELGWQFAMRLDQDNIDIRRVDSDIGTKISIELTDSIIKKLDKESTWRSLKWYDWFEGEKPIIKYMDDGREISWNKTLKYVKKYQLKQSEYSKYYWSYNKILFSNNKDVCCNGIVIPYGAHFEYGQEYRYRLRTPYIEIEDLEGKLSINLARSEVLQVPCQEELYTECCKYVLAQILSIDFTGDRIQNRIYNYSKYGNEGEYIIYTKNGYTICDAAFIEMSGIKSINIIGVSSRFKDNEMTVIDSDTPIMFHLLTRAGVTKVLFEDILNEVFLNENLKVTLNCLHLEKKAYMYVKDRMAKSKLECFEVNEKGDKYTISPANSMLSETIKFSIDNFPIVAEYDVEVRDLCKKDIMLKVLKKYLKSNVFIPYDISERKRMFPKAFKELEKYMK